MLPLYSSGNGHGPRTTSPEDLDRWIRKHGSDVEGGEPNWTFRFEDVNAYCQCQRDVDRMRIVAPICEVEQFGEQHEQLLEIMLQANYHSALDPRYAIDRGVVMSAYLHPLAAQDEAQFVSGLRQVVEMVRTFGTTFSSTGIVFGGPE